MNGWPWPMHGIPHQVAWFRRGDSARVVAATDIAEDSVLVPWKFRAEMFLQRDFDQPARMVAGSGRGIYRFGMLVPRDSTLASIELVATNLTTGRARLGTGMPPMPNQRVTMSDILLVEPWAQLPANLAEAESRSFGKTTFEAGSQIGIFWEVYGLSARERPRMTVVAERERGSLLGGLFGSIFSRAQVDSAGVQWEEGPSAGRDIEPGAVNLSLGLLVPGNYTLSVAVEVPGQQRTVVRRQIQIVRKPSQGVEIH